jgi:hypothetical protein
MRYPRCDLRSDAHRGQHLEKCWSSSDTQAATIPRSATDWVSNLAGFEIELLRDGAVVNRSHAANVLGGPLSALGLVRAWR